MSQPSLILPPGTILGGFEIEDVLGIGGMAVVYRAVQTSLGRRVALKVLNARLAADSTFRERFRREGSLVAALDHPNVIPVYDSGEADGRMYLAMRLIDGDTLADRMHEGISPAETLGLVERVGAALDAAHAADLLHRDIKPQNILISHSGHVYLADFGVAKVAGGGGDLTKTGGFLGSISYVSPEQIRGEVVGPPADVYALASVAYECLAGETPFRRDTEAGVIHAHLSDAPPPLEPTSDPWAAAASRVIARALAKDPADRPQHAGEFATDLAAALRGASDDLLQRRPGFPAVAPESPDSVGRAAVEQPGAPVAFAGPVAASAVGVAAGGVAAPPARSMPPGPPAPTIPAPQNATVHDRQRSEFVPVVHKRSPGDWFFLTAPWLALVAAIAAPFGIAHLVRDKPVARVTIGAVTAPPITGWTQTASPELTKRQTAGLSVATSTAWSAPKGEAVVVVANLRSTSPLAPTSLGKDEQVTRLAIADGTARRWRVAGEHPQAIAVTGAPDGATAVICTGNPAAVGTACDRMLAQLDAPSGTLEADPSPLVATAIGTSLAAASAVRAKLALPRADRASRARRARAVAKAYAVTAKNIGGLSARRPWDADVKALAADLDTTRAAFSAIASAANGKARGADGQALGGLANADRRVAAVLTHLRRRGYAVR